ncbi:NAD(P)/FAD-dependent oxidoreductase [Jannaschia sp. LMIT008]|uniref:NAD(P)/FAD-dependent oxidoreductase n=1 Tax=Jannaschia maritima TaxID=3032585 RepID=UPI002811830C|nr:FAD-dependent oxidoreductase [Jannaschia sp. LMIT008]
MTSSHANGDRSWLHANGDDGTYPATFYAHGKALPPPRPPLDGDARADLCVVGGGITGLSAALHAAQAGLSVVLLDAQRTSWGASGRNGGQVGYGFNWSDATLRARLGPRADAAIALGASAIPLTRALIAAHAPEADFRPGILHAARTESAFRALRRDAPGAEALDRDALRHAIGSDAYAGGVVEPEGGWIDPLAYALGLARAAETAGAAIHERTRATHVATGTVTTPTGTVAARHVVLATNGYDRLLGAQAARVLPINNFIAVTGPGVSPMTRPLAVADDRFVVNYFHPTRDGRIVYGGGESYGRRFPRDIRDRVRRNLARVYPALAGVDLTHAWGGTLAVTATRLPYLAEPIPRVFATGGYSGHGLAMSALWGKLCADAATGDRAAFDAGASLPVPALPGGRVLGPWMAQAGMVWGAVMDRL